MDQYRFPMGKRNDDVDAVVVVVVAGVTTISLVDCCETDKDDDDDDVVMTSSPFALKTKPKTIVATRTDAFKAADN
jgi:hypothetical protein